MSILGIIPSRYASTRFPGKPLAVIEGKTMIQRVYERVSQSEILDKVVVATDHELIFNHVRQFGGEVMMTASSHQTGTERCAETANRLHAQNDDILINIQGDEPFINPGQVSQICNCFSNPGVQIATLVKQITEHEMIADPNVVKAVLNLDHSVMYFSRSPIPYCRGYNQNEWISQTVYFKHIGIYGFRKQVLDELVKLPISQLEKTEELEQLRWLENGWTIYAYMTEFENISIDTPADILKISNKT